MCSLGTESWNGRSHAAAELERGLMTGNVTRGSASDKQRHARELHVARLATSIRDPKLPAIEAEGRLPFQFTCGSRPSQ